MASGGEGGQQQEQNKLKEVITGSATYEGETNGGMKHGMGTLTWDDGDQYVGEFKFDEKTNGTFRWKGGDTYTGEWKSSLMHGKGTYTYKNGRMYEGSWEEGYKQGLGVFTWPNEDKYAGEFYKDMCHGVGILYYADGRVYKGNWQQNKKHGYGTMKLPNGEKIEGRWTNNLLNGKAIFTEMNGDRYEEVYKDEIPEGPRKALKRKGADMEKLLKSTERPTWLPDSQAGTCFACDTAFAIFNRRHHCRHCGLVFCNNCTLNKISIRRLGHVEPVRVCEECYMAIITDINVPITFE
mmetsp:Transcript_886/g.3265  ORF Transcript_886/g.3265 Transcript_886/m.3265 type:complete len:295 (+) Transcript_886:241-1125(+)